MCCEIHTAEDGGCAKNLEHTDLLGKEEHTADHADDGGDVLKDGGNGGTDAAHAEVPEEHCHDTAKDDGVEKRGEERRGQRRRVKGVRKNAVEDRRKCPEYARPSRAERGGDALHDAHGEDGVHRPRDLREQEEDVTIVERKPDEYLPRAVADDGERTEEGDGNAAPSDCVQSLAQKDGGKKESLLLKKYRLPVLLAFLIAFFNQMSGINAFLYYAPRIFEIAGLEKSSALLSSVGIGVVNLIFTFVGLSLIDKFGRRQLMYIGSFGYIVSLGLVSLSFFLGWKGMMVPLFFFLFIAAHAVGQGTVIWVFISEIFPSHLRAQGQALGSSTHWVLAAAIPAAIPYLFDEIGASWVFACFTAMMVLQLVFVMFMMPETKGVPLEELSKSLIKEES